MHGESISKTRMIDRSQIVRKVTNFSDSVPDHVVNEDVHDSVCTVQLIWQTSRIWAEKTCPRYMALWCKFVLALSMTNHWLKMVSNWNNSVLTTRSGSLLESTADWTTAAIQRGTQKNLSIHVFCALKHRGTKSSRHKFIE